MKSSCLLALLLLGVSTASAAPTPNWIWADADMPRAREASFRHAFDVTGRIREAELTGVADFCTVTIELNGERVTQVEPFSPPFRFDITEHLKAGKNAIVLRAKGHAGPSAVAARLRLTFADGKERFLVTGKDWGGVDLGAVAEEPWGDHPDTVTITPLDDYTQWKQALGADADAAKSRFSLPDGYQIELLRQAKPGEGSWISLEFDPKGRFLNAHLAELFGESLGL